MKIYEIDQAILDCIDAETGEIIDIERLDALQLARDEKVDNLACLYKQCIAEAEAIKQEKIALGDRQNSKETQAERLKNYLSDVLQGQKLETARNKISWRTSDSVNIIDESMIPADFVETVITKKPLKDEIKKAIKNGQTIQGVELVGKNNIQIK